VVRNFLQPIARQTTGGMRWQYFATTITDILRVLVWLKITQACDSMHGNALSQGRR
jgi:hypothetical protein